MTDPTPENPDPQIPDDLTAGAPKLSDNRSDELLQALSSSRNPIPIPTAGPSFVVLREPSQGMTPAIAEPIAVTVAPDDTLYILDRPEPNRFRLTQIKDVAVLRSVYLERGNSEKQLRGPAALVIDPHGNIFVADADSNRIQKFNAEGAWLASFGGAGFEGAEFSGPRGIALDGQGNLLVADTNNHRIVALLPDGELAWELERFPASEGPDDEFNEPYSVTVGGTVFAVADTNNNRVVVFDGERRTLTTREVGGLVFPSAVQLSEDGGTLWVADQGNLRVRRYDAHGQGMGKLTLVEGSSVASGGTQMAVDSRGQIALIHPIRQSVVVLDFVGGKS